MSKEKLARRKAMGDDPTAKTQSNSSEAGAIPAPQPIPGAPQGAGNMMNNPMNGNSFNPQVGSMSGFNLYPYGDGGLPLADGRMGGVGFVANSKQLAEFGQGNAITGRGYQSQIPYGQQPQPNGKTMEMMDGMGLAQDSAKIMERQYGEGCRSLSSGSDGRIHTRPLEGGAPALLRLIHVNHSRCSTRCLCRECLTHKQLQVWIQRKANVTHKVKTNGNYCN